MSVSLVAILNWYPVAAPRRSLICAGLGLLHGLALGLEFAASGVAPAVLTLSAVGFNTGVVLGQISLVGFAFPVLMGMRESTGYTMVVLRGGSLLLAVLAWGSWLGGGR